MKRPNIYVFCILLLLSNVSIAQEKHHFTAIDENDSPQEIIRKAAHIVPTERQLRWQKLELTAFFHFGINTFSNREWGDGKEDPKIFNPEKLDAEQWIKTVKEAGFKQIILTAKHHDGFCLWPTKTTNHSVKSSPWKNGNGDVVREVSEACKKHEIGFGVYLSPWDRNAASYGTDDYNEFFEAQLKELLTQYGKIDEVWFDGACGEGANGKKQVYDFLNWYSIIRELQPQAVIAIMGPDVRWVGTESGKGRNTEWSVIPSNQTDQFLIMKNSQQDLIYKPLGNMMEDDLGGREAISSAKGLLWYPAETDVSIRPGWFYHAYEDLKVKTPKELLDIYFTSVGMNSVLLLNIPPDTNGLINEHDVKSLQGFKQLMDETFGENLALGAQISSPNGIDEQAIIDQNDHSYYTTKDNDTSTYIDISLPEKRTFNLLMLQENISIGQRVENFQLEYLASNGEWKQVASGTTIGYKRILKFETINAQKLRLKILSSRLNPTISELGLFYLKPIPDETNLK